MKYFYVFSTARLRIVQKEFLKASKNLKHKELRTKKFLKLAKCVRTAFKFSCSSQTKFSVQPLKWYDHWKVAAKTDWEEELLVPCIRNIVKSLRKIPVFLKKRLKNIWCIYLGMPFSSVSGDFTPEELTAMLQEQYRQDKSSRRNRITAVILIYISVLCEMFSAHSVYIALLPYLVNDRVKARNILI